MGERAVVGVVDESGAAVERDVVSLECGFDERRELASPVEHDRDVVGVLCSDCVDDGVDERRGGIEAVERWSVELTVVERVVRIVVVEESRPSPRSGETSAEVGTDGDGGDG